MIVPTLIRQIDFPGTDNVCLYRYSIPSVPASTISDEIEFTFSNPAKFENVRIACLSKNYQFSLRLEPLATIPSIEEIYNVISISESYFDDNMDVWWAKPVGIDQHKLYGKIKNVDSVNATGTVLFEFVLICF